MKFYRDHHNAFSRNDFNNQFIVKWSESVTFSGCICNVHLCSDVFLHYGICHGNHHCRYNLLMNENQHIILVSLFFLLRSIIQKELKRDPPVPPAAVVQVHWLSTQWSSAPPEQVVVVQSPSLLHVSAYTESILSFDLYNGVKMQRFHSWTHYPRNSFFYAERKKK